MPRLSRNLLPSHFVHLIVQGINREYIFKENSWKSHYKSLIKNNFSDANISIVAYCIMDNHAHFLVFYDNINVLCKSMQKTNTCYAMHYNKLNNRKGYVFRDRYYSQPIMDENHLYNCLVYIHRNPVSASIVTNMDDYFFSSYREYTRQIRFNNTRCNSTNFWN